MAASELAWKIQWGMAYYTVKYNCIKEFVLYSYNTVPLYSALYSAPGKKDRTTNQCRARLKWKYGMARSSKTPYKQSPGKKDRTRHDVVGFVAEKTDARNIQHNNDSRRRRARRRIPTTFEQHTFRLLQYCTTVYNTVIILQLYYTSSYITHYTVYYTAV